MDPADTQGATEGAADAPDTTQTDPGDVSEGTEAPPDEVDVFSEDHGVGWLTEFDARENAPAFKVKREALDGLPMEAKQVIHNLRKDYQAKTTAASRLRKEAEDALAQVRREKLELDRGRAKLLELFGDEELRKAATPPKEPEGGPPPIHTEEGIRYAVEKLVAERLAQHLDGYKTVAEKKKAEIAAADEATAREARKAEVLAFVKATPDFDDYRDEVIKIRTERGLPVEEAYLLAKAKRGRTAADPVGDARRDARRSITPRSNTAGGLLKPPPGLTGSQLYDWYEAHPEEAAAVRRRHAR